MAGVEFCKIKKISNLREASCHFDNNIRCLPTVPHSNESIDIGFTHQNYYIGFTDYRELCDRIERRIIEADEKNPPKRIRADRITCFTLEVPCPPELEGTEQEDIFFQKVYDMYKEYMPGLEGAEIHKDEKHEYYDPKKKTMVESRDHMHCFGASITNDGRCNNSDFMNKAMCQKINDDIQNLCLKEWGISYQTGEGRNGAKKKVEQLKQESYVALQETLEKENLQTVQALKEEKPKIIAENIELKRKRTQINSDVTKGKEQKQSIEEDIKDLDKIKKNRTDDISNLERRIKTLDEELKKLEPLKNEVANLQEEKQTLISENKSLKEENKTLRESLKQVVQEILVPFADTLKNAHIKLNMVMEENAYKKIGSYVHKLGEKGIEGYTRILSRLGINEKPREEDKDGIQIATEKLKKISSVSSTVALKMIDEDDEYER